MRRPCSFYAFFFALYALSLFSFGCGVMGDPVPYLRNHPPPVEPPAPPATPPAPAATDPAKAKAGR